MKVCELIERLQKLDPELDVLVSGYEGGVHDVDQLNPVTYIRDINNEQWYYGNHEKLDAYMRAEYPDKPEHKGVHIK